MNHQGGRNRNQGRNRRAMNDRNDNGVAVPARGCKTSRVPGAPPPPPLSPIELNRAKEWSRAIEQIASQNQYRCEQMKECQKHIDEWRARLSALQLEHRRAMQHAAVYNDPFEWIRLSKKDKWNKSIIMTLLHSPHALPEEFTHNEVSFKTKPNAPNTSCFLPLPEHLWNDREVLLACLNREEFIDRFREIEEDRFFLPLKFYDDEEVYLKLIQVLPTWLEYMVFDAEDSLLMENESEIQSTSSFISRLLNDADVFKTLVEATLESYGALESARHLSYTMARFSDNIRNDPDLMIRIFTGTETTINNNAQCIPARLHNVMDLQVLGRALRNDRAFALQVADVVDKNKLSCHALAFFDGPIRSDIEVVLAFCAKNGYSLQHASKNLRMNQDVIRIACEAHPSALRFSIFNRYARAPLARSKEFMLDLFRREATQEYPIFGDLVTTFGKEVLWSICSKHLKKHCDICAAAVICGCARIANVHEMEEKFPFWADVFRKRGDLWFEMMKKNIFSRQQKLELALIVLNGIDSETADAMMLAIEILSMFPTLISTEAPGRAALMHLSKHLDMDALWRALPLRIPNFSQAHAGILHDREFVVAACRSSDGAFARHVPLDILGEREIVQSCFESSLKSLEIIPADIQLAYPDVMVQAILKTDDQIYYADSIAEPLWSNREVAMAWLSTGGGYLEYEFPLAFQEDHEIFLKVAEDCPQDFDLIAPELLANKSFMLQAVAKNATLWELCSKAIRFDFDLCLVAFSTTVDCDEFLANEVGAVFSPSHPNYDFLVGFAKEVRKRIECHEGFVNEVLGSMTHGRFSRNHKKSCCLPLLNQGKETSMVYKKLMAEYVGVPMGKELGLLRRASLNLAKWGF